MQKYIRDLFNDSILQRTMAYYGIAGDKIKPLDAFESLIFEFERDSGAYILRIGHSNRRSEALIQGEVDWINYLAAGGVSVARAIYSERGKLVEKVEDSQGGHFLATAFVKARGDHPWKVGWSPAVYETYGRLMGSMHALARDYRLVNPAWKRPEWDDPSMEFADQYLPASEAVVKEKYRRLMAHLRILPKDRDSYGLTHQDAHMANMFLDEAGTLTLFDFDDCAYHWFMNDIAIVLFYMAMEEKDPLAFTPEFMAHFFRGYRQAYRIDPAWLKEIPNFLKLREIDLYAVIHRDFDVNNIDDWWIERFMRDRKHRIENDVPYIDFDFETLAPHL